MKYEFTIVTTVITYFLICIKISFKITKQIRGQTLLNKSSKSPQIHWSHDQSVPKTLYTISSAHFHPFVGRVLITIPLPTTSVLSEGQFGYAVSCHCDSSRILPSLGPVVIELGAQAALAASALERQQLNRHQKEYDDWLKWSWRHAGTSREPSNRLGNNPGRLV